MGATQPLKGGSNKYYELMTVFNRGIDKKTADDLASDSSFRNLKNFYNESEGVLSKRPGAYNSNFVEFIKSLIDESYSDKFVIETNRFGINKSFNIEELRRFYNAILCGEKKVITHATSHKVTFEFDKIIGFQIIKNTKFLEALQDYRTILNGEYSSVVDSTHISFVCLIVAGGFSTIMDEDGTNERDKYTALYITRLGIDMTYNTDSGYKVTLEVNSADPTMYSGLPRKWLYIPENYASVLKNAGAIDKDDTYKPLGPIDIANYNGMSYIPTGKDYIIQIDQMPDSTTIDPYAIAPFFKIIGGHQQENLYKPTPIETTQIGFNILANSPLDYISKTGAIAKVKGVFYSVNITNNGETFKQPVTKVPFNGEFNVHILYTGTTKPSAPQYRPDTGETDTEKNPYKDLPGSFKTGDNSLYVCTGIDSDQRFELKVTLGSDTFITYIDTSSSSIDETGYINVINDLVFSSQRAKVINNQLVLYGGHGYLFFSEYDMFNYFPNYNYIYIATEAGEETVTSINYFRQFHTVFTNKRIKKMTGTFGTDDFGIYPLNDFIGCANGNTVKAVGNNLIFLGNDGVYKLKQGYLGEGTENVEKLDLAIEGELNASNVIQALTLNNNYVVVKNDGYSWFIYNTETESFYEYNLESLDGQVYEGDELNDYFKRNTMPFYSIFESSLYDSNGNFFIIPMYRYEYSKDYKTFTKKGVDFRLFRFSDLDFISIENRHKDGYGYISTLETHALSMGYPTHTKKFKDVYIKMKNESGRAIPLYVTIYVDDKIIINPDDYVVVYNEITNTYYYIRKVESNKTLDISRALGEFTLGVDPLGSKTIQQIKLRVGTSGRSIRIKLSDGYNDTTELSTGSIVHVGKPIRNRNDYDFTILAMGIVYKLKKVKEDR